MNENQIIAVSQTALALYKNGYGPGDHQFETAVDALTEGLSKSSGEEIERDTAHFLLALSYYSMMCMGEVVYGELSAKDENVESADMSSDNPCDGCTEDTDCIKCDKTGDYHVCLHCGDTDDICSCSSEEDSETFDKTEVLTPQEIRERVGAKA